MGKQCRKFPYPGTLKLESDAKYNNFVEIKTNKVYTFEWIVSLVFIKRTIGLFFENSPQTDPAEILMYPFLRALKERLEESILESRSS